MTTSTSKRSPGRPALPNEDRLGNLVVIRLTPGDDALLAGAAMRARLTRSAYIRRAILRATTAETA